MGGEGSVRTGSRAFARNRGKALVVSSSPERSGSAGEGELDVAGRCGTALRLADVVDRLDVAERYKVAIDASLSLGKPGAVRLTSAHSSKGLEFDCVYLADADDGTWHKGAASGGLYPDNLLIGDAKDEDDARRLLFVALTRARRHLLLFRAAGQTLQELVGEVSTDNVPPEPECLDAAIECDWRASYKLDTPELAALDEALAGYAIRTAVTRHAGRIEEVYTMMGLAYAQTGKNLMNVERLVVTGGSLIHTKNTRKIASYALY